MATPFSAMQAQTENELLPLAHAIAGCSDPTKCRLVLGWGAIRQIGDLALRHAPYQRPPIQEFAAEWAAGHATDGGQA